MRTTFLFLLAACAFGCSARMSAPEPATPVPATADDLLDVLQADLEAQSWKFTVDPDGARRVVEVDGKRL